MIGLRVASVVVAAIVLAGALASAQTFPTKLVTIVVPVAPGGATGAIAQVLAQKLSETWGQRVVIENKPGGNHRIAVNYVGQSNPDGHTLLMSAEATFVINPFLYKKENFEPLKTLVPVAGLARSSQGLIVNPSLPARNVQELIALAKAKPGGIHYGTTGIGSTGHLNAELLGNMTGVKMTPVHYRGAAPSITDVIGGHIQMMIVSLGLAVPPSRGGQVRMLAIGAPKRHPALPDIPTVIESGVPGYHAPTWFGLFAPRGTPAALVNSLNEQIHRIFDDPAVRSKYLDGLFFETIPETAAEFSAYIDAERTKWQKVIRDANVTVE